MKNLNLYVEHIYYIASNKTSYFDTFTFNNKVTQFTYNLDKQLNVLYNYKKEAYIRCIKDALYNKYEKIIILTDNAVFTDNLDEVISSLSGNICILNKEDINEDCVYLDKKAIELIGSQRFDFSKSNWYRNLKKLIKENLIVTYSNYQACYHQIDYVMTYVNCDDEIWKQEYLKYNHNIDTRRFKDYGTLKLNIELVRKNMPWINNIYLVVSSYSQVKDYLDNVKIILHNDIIPKEFLPTFNSRAIEIFLPFIEGLSEYWIYANDDMFVTNNIDKTKLYKNGKIITKFEDITQHNQYALVCKNVYEFCSKFFDTKYIKANKHKYKTLYHTIHPYLKSTGLHLHALRKNDIYNSISRFREDKNLNQYIYGIYEYLINNYEDSKLNFNYNTCINKEDIEKSNAHTLCCNNIISNNNDINIDILKSEKIIISLTSYPARIKYVKLVLESVIKQDIPKNLYHIVLVLAEPEFPNKENDLPQDLVRYITENNIEIIWYYRNIRSHKKLMPTLSKYPDNPILIIDDDVIRPNGWLKMFIEDHIKYPNDIICGAVKQYLTKDFKWEDYNGPRIHTNAGNICIIPNMYINLQKPMNGFGGTLYPKNTFTDIQFFDEDLMMKLSPTSDENWQWCFNIKEKRNMRTTSLIYDYSKYTLAGSQELSSSLYKVNNKKYNDILNTMCENLPDLKKSILEKIPLYDKKYCIVTIVNDDFVCGCQTMIYSFLKHNSWFDGDILILYSNTYSQLNDININILSKLYHKIKFIKINDTKYSNIVNTGIIQQKFIPPIIKFEIFGLTDYDKVLYLDSDTLIIRNIYKLFCNDTDIIVMPHERDIITKPKIWKGEEDINNGVIMLNKNILSQKTVDNLVNITYIYNKNVEWYKACPDQDIMSYYLLHQTTYKVLIYTNDFNTLKRVYMGNIKQITNERIIHYIMEKPWNDNREKQKIYAYIYKLWFKYYNEYQNIKLY